MDYFIANYDRIAMATMRHAQICAISIGFALLIGVPLGIVAAKIRWLGTFILGTISVIYTIPTLALFGLMIPILGIGLVPALVAITLYSLLPVVQNTYTGIVTVQPAAIEAARGLGMGSLQRLARIELPLALLVIVAGIRTAVVGAIGMATLASLIGAGGLGDLVFRGISTVSLNVVLAGSIPVVAIAVLADLAMKWGQKYMAGRMLGGEAN